MTVFPYTLVRWAGGAFDDLLELELRGCSALAERVFAAERALADLADVACSALYGLVSASGSVGRRFGLLALKRDIFNGRQVARERLADLALPTEAASAVADWLAAMQDLSALRQEAAEAFAAEARIARDHLRKMTANPRFLQGLLLASMDLFESAESYLAGERQGSRLSSRNRRKMEQGLIKYLSRFHAKTSPFSTFTTLSLAGNAPDRDFVSVPVEAAGVRSHVRLNGYLLYNLGRRLGTVSEIRGRLPLRLNPTIAPVGEQLAFLVNENNTESFQRISRHPLAELLLADLSGTSRPRREIVAKWLDVVDAPVEALEEFLDRLLDVGFLEVDLCVSGLDPDWDLRLEARLAELAPDLGPASRLRERLKALRALTLRYERADLVDRRMLLRCVQAEITEMVRELEGEPEEQEALDEKVPMDIDGFVFTRRILPDVRFGHANFLFEDAEECTPLTFSQDLMADLEGCLDALASELALFDWAADERNQLLAFCRYRYPESATGPVNVSGGGDIELLRLYEDYYRDFRLPEQEGLLKEVEAEAGEAAMAVRAVLRAREERSACKREWLSAVRSAVRAGACWDSEAAYLDRTHLRAGGAPRLPAERSLGCFLQLAFPEGGEPVGVLQHGVLLPGYGKLMSRFLHFFGPAATAALRTCNRQLHTDSLAVENCDGSFFNANLHPPLLDLEVGLPSGQNGLPSERRIPVSSLRVRWTDEDLHLVHAPTGRTVRIFDLGFQTNGRSPLFQLLRVFTPVGTLSVHPLLEVVSEAWNERGLVEAVEGRQIGRLPRVVFSRCIVLQRRKWIVPKSLLPRLDEIHDEEAVFLEAQRWRLQHGIPERVFITIQERKRAEGDDGKPQYMSFSDPFLVRLLSKALRRVEESLVIEEMLPGPDELLRVAGSSRVTELAVQWYSGPGGGDD